jgi:hypothetical protein
MGYRLWVDSQGDIYLADVLGKASQNIYVSDSSTTPLSLHEGERC